MAEADESLRSMFVRAHKLEQDLQSLQSTSSAYQETVRAAIATYEDCKRAVSSISLFSPNESIEDISSNDIQYLSLDFHVGNLVQRDSARDRKEAIRAAQSSYDDFLQLQTSYGTLAASDRKTYSRFQEDRDAFSVVSASDPSKRRDGKIARLREEKALKAQLEVLKQRPAELNYDDEALREVRLAELSLHTHETFQALDMIAQELKILAMAPSGPGPDPRQLAEDHRQRTTGQSAGSVYSERLDSNLRDLQRNGKAGPILDERGRPLQPFVLMDQRKDLRNGVFRSGHNLPTMSIDEYLEEERRRGGIIEGGGEPPVVEPDEDDLEKADAETMKKREWDEYVEANPKGSGNTLNRG